MEKENFHHRAHREHKERFIKQVFVLKKKRYSQKIMNEEVARQNQIGVSDEGNSHRLLLKREIQYDKAAATIRFRFFIKYSTKERAIDGT